ncbi:hypothetical protein T440DRAFT_544761 [Plenodomus tracheiphilus IPT5]|uniref:Uncharacterized protein n=1 Tax=Plenodomus tracheiphilus IPT5 TaxID=1408161 RepID=A0A6A7BIY7_9PLEO|nr:hypothetical protein T440DRAFT_544761 [Plenodomus tracheiphilus IPT5]
MGTNRKPSSSCTSPAPEGQKHSIEWRVQRGCWPSPEPGVAFPTTGTAIVKSPHLHSSSAFLWPDRPRRQGRSAWGERPEDASRLPNWKGPAKGEGTAAEAVEMAGACPISRCAPRVSPVERRDAESDCETIRTRRRRPQRMWKLKQGSSEHKTGEEPQNSSIGPQTRMKLASLRFGTERSLEVNMRMHDGRLRTSAQEHEGRGLYRDHHSTAPNRHGTSGGAEDATSGGASELPSPPPNEAPTAKPEWRHRSQANSAHQQQEKHKPKTSVSNSAAIALRDGRPLKLLSSERLARPHPHRQTSPPNHNGPDTAPKQSHDDGDSHRPRARVPTNCCHSFAGSLENTHPIDDAGAQDEHTTNRARAVAGLADYRGTEDVDMEIHELEAEGACQPVSRECVVGLRQGTR